jgi:molybdopterin synthase catalytic subunit
MRTAIVSRPIDSARLLEEVAGNRNGATVLFVGTVREQNDGQPVTGLDYSAYAAMAERELETIVAEAAAMGGTADIVVEHRVGTLGLGDASVAIAVAHPHRGKAYEASRYIIEELKQRLPIWKREHYTDGRSEWVENTGATGPAPSASATRRPATKKAAAAKRGKASKAVKPVKRAGAAKRKRARS